MTTTTMMMMMRFGFSYGFSFSVNLMVSEHDCDRLCSPMSGAAVLWLVLVWIFGQCFRNTFLIIVWKKC